MKNRKRLFALLLSLFLAASLCACTGEQADSSEPPSEALTPDPTAAPTVEVDLSQDMAVFSAGLSPTDVLLTVNGADVPADLFLYLLFWDCYYFEYNYYYYYYYGYTMDDFAEDLLEDTVDQALYYTLLHQKAAELGCVLTDDQQAELESYKTGDEQESYEQYRAAFGLSDESMSFLDANRYYYENLLNAVTAEPSDQELWDYLDDQGAFYVKHILLMTVDQSTYEDLSEDEITKKKALADDLLARLQAAEDMPALFDDLMNEYSEDGGLTTNPDGYVFTDSDSLVEGFREVALELEDGQLSGVVETDYGYHIMLRLALTDMTDEMRESYRRAIRQEDLDGQVDQWTDAAEITRAGALDDIDVADFYERYLAYYTAFMEQYEAAAEG